MDFLTLCQRLRQETGIADSGPSAVTGQTGDMKRIVDWVNESWIRIQSSRPDWLWMWKSASSTLSVGNQVFTPATDVENIVDVYVGGTTVLSRLEYRDYRDLYRSLNSGKPTAYTIRHDGVVLMNTLPDQAYTISYEYFKKPAYFTANGDVPGLPTRFHMLIVHGALAEYGMFDEAPELVQKARLNYEQVMAELVRDQAPEMQLPGALA